MPVQIKEKVVEPDTELINVLRTYKTLAPLCSLEKRSAGEPQLAPQEKQLNILENELKETLLCIKIATKGQHAIRDAKFKSNLSESINEYQNLMDELRDKRGQQTELDSLNYLAQKLIRDLSKQVPSETDELAMIESAHNRLRRMENRLDLATKRFCVVNWDNREIRDEINRLLIERNNFNIQWNRTIGKLMKGKEYLIEILEIASETFGKRDDCCKKLETLKWKGLFQLNRDISEMQTYEEELNHLAKLEEFVRVKGSRRICEAEDKEELKRQEDVMKCEEEIVKLNTLLDEIFAFAGCDTTRAIIRHFQHDDIENFSLLILLCEIYQASNFLRRELDTLRQKILDQMDMNQAREEIEDKELTDLTLQLTELQKLNREKQEICDVSDIKIAKVMEGIKEIMKLANCDTTPLLSLLGNHNDVTRWNVAKFLSILEMEIKDLIQVVYGEVKHPPPTPKPHKGVSAPLTRKLVADPHVQILRPNRIEKFVPYKPCVYCVEDYITNLVSETPVVPADEDYVENILYLEDPNTKFGIYTLTVPAKRHPFRGRKNE